MELYQHLLVQQLGSVEQYFMILYVIDILDLEGRHPYIPYHSARRSPKLDVLGGNQCFGQVWLGVFLRQHINREIQVILIDETPIITLPFLVKRAVPVIRQDAILVGLFHSLR